MFHHEPDTSTLPTTREIDSLEELLRLGDVVALTGAGISTESGIPDYRSPEALTRVRKPIHGPEFIRSSKLRQRYWARAMAGWERFRNASPNVAHRVLADFEVNRGSLRSIITQNVDRLHQHAGSMNVHELHGALAEVHCLDCNALEIRDDMQKRMRLENPNWIDGPTPMAPDGDAELSAELVDRFVVPTCTVCGGPMKPRVVFFGENVARPVVDAAFAEVDRANALLVVGTSLAVFSGFRFLRRAAERKIPIAIVNRGAVRGEEHATLKIEKSTGTTLEMLQSRFIDKTS